MTTTAYSFAAILTGIGSRTRHVIGLPEELTGEPTQPLPEAAVVLIERGPEGIFLIRYAAMGEFAGDTWHRTHDEALEQAQFEYGNRLGSWHAIPDGTEDPVAFALNELR